MLAFSDNEDDAIFCPTSSSTQNNRRPHNEVSQDVYSATYSGVAVYEMMCRTVAVMRRRADSFLNATQILKVAGIDKGRRTKILERVISNGEHEKVQGGYGKYQGTWIPFERGAQLAQQHGVKNLLRPILEFEPPSEHNGNVKVLRKEEYVKHYAISKEGGLSSTKKTKRNSLTTDISRKKARVSIHSLASEAPDSMEIDNGFATESPLSINPKIQHCTDTNMNPERHRATLMAMFLNEDPNFAPQLLTMPDPPADLDIDLVIDEQGHSCLHWAAALSRVYVLRILMSKQVDVTKKNNDGETALIRSVLVTNNFDNQTFNQVLELLHRSIPLVDHKGRTVLHHIAITAGIKGRSHASKYYMECLLERIARYDGDFSCIVDVQDLHGDTALNIAARIGNKSLIEQLLDVGADPNIENRAGLRPCDFGIDAFSVINRMNTKKDTTEVIIKEGGRRNAFEDVEFMRSGKLDNDSHLNHQKPSSSIDKPQITFPVMKMDRVGGQSISTTSYERFDSLSAKLQTKGKQTTEKITSLVQDIANGYLAELSTNDDMLKECQKNVRDITQELGNLRRMNEGLKTENAGIPAMRQRITNLEYCLTQEMAKNALMMLDIPSASTPQSQEPLSLANPAEQIQKLENVINNHEAVEKDLRGQVVQLRGQMGENEIKCKKLISKCTGIALEGIDEVIDALLDSLDSDDDAVNVSQLAGFMARVNGV